MKLFLAIEMAHQVLTRVILKNMIGWYRKLGPQQFTLWLFVAVGLAVIFPGPASKGGWLQAATLTKVAVWVIFFFQGLSLPTQELLRGYRPWTLHAAALGWNFLFFPAVTFLLLALVGPLVPTEFRVGFFLLAILPTTVTSAVMFTTLAGGDTPTAIFATVFSNLLAILLVPLAGSGLLAASGGVQVSLGPLFGTLLLLIVLPLTLGQLLRWRAPAAAKALSRHGKTTSNNGILFIVHAAFASSISSGFFQAASPWAVLGVAVTTLALLLSVTWLTWQSSRLAALHLALPHRITLLFCGSQKSIATGLPILTMLLAQGADPRLSAAALLPLICFHPLQLILAGLLTPRWYRLANPPAAERGTA